jgi:hypothetical protein
MRPWYRIHFSTLAVVGIIFAWMVFINIPADRTLGSRGRFYHGWPYLYFERNGDPHSWWSFAGGGIPEFHIEALLLNMLVAFCIAALAAFACELWIQRYGRLFRFSILSMLVVTALVASMMGVVVRDLQRSYRQGEVLDELAKLGSVEASRTECRYDWFRSLFGSNLDGTIDGILFISSSPAGATVPDLSALSDLTSLEWQGVALGSTELERLSNLPNLKTLVVSVHSLHSESATTLTKLSEHPALLALRLYGDQFDDESVSNISSQSQIKGLGIKSARVTGRSVLHISNLESLEGFYIEGARMRDADFSPLARLLKLKSVMFVNCNLSQADEDQLLERWPKGNLHTSIGPDKELVQAFQTQ